MLNRLSLFVFLAFAFVASVGFAGKGGADVSGGGGGVQIGSKVYLYDLYEAGLHQTPYIEHKAGDIEFENEFTKASLPQEASLVLLARKLRDIETLDPYLAAALVEGFKVLSWRVVDQKLERSPDFGNDVKEVELLQLANRRGGIVQIQRSLWNMMDDANRVALIIHETLAALQPAQAQGNQGPLRRLVAYLFDKKFFDGLESNGQIAFSGFPSYYEVKKRLRAEQPYLPEPYRHFTRYTPVQKQDGGSTIALMASFLLSPYANLVWSDETKFEPKQAYLVPHYFELPSTQYCSVPRKAPRLLEMQIQYLRMKVSLTSYQPNGSTLPMLTWAVEDRHLMTIKFDPRPSAAKANCTSQNRALWETMQYWNQSVMGEGANAN